MGVDVIRDERMLHPLVRRRFVERRRHRPMWHTTNGIVIGLCGGMIATTQAQGGSEWTSPSTLMGVVTMIFAFGMMWQARNEDRRRIEKLENESASKEVVSALGETMKRIEGKLDQVIMERN